MRLHVHWRCCCFRQSYLCICKLPVQRLRWWIYFNLSSNRSWYHQHPLRIRFSQYFAGTIWQHLLRIRFFPYFAVVQTYPRNYSDKAYSLLFYQDLILCFLMLCLAFLQLFSCTRIDFFPTKMRQILHSIYLIWCGK